MFNLTMAAAWKTFYMWSGSFFKCTRLNSFIKAVPSYDQRVRMK